MSDNERETEERAAQKARRILGEDIGFVQSLAPDLWLTLADSI